MAKAWQWVFLAPSSVGWFGILFVVLDVYCLALVDRNLALRLHFTQFRYKDGVLEDAAQLFMWDFGGKTAITASPSHTHIKSLPRSCVILT